MKQVFIICGIIVVLVASLFSWSWIEGAKESQEIKPFITYKRLLYVASWCDKYKDQNGVWPSSLQQLKAFRSELDAPWTTDAWDRDFIIIPYDTAAGYGEIVSYGRDMKLGGIGDDRDLIIRFPTAANADWNKQQGIGLKEPRMRP